ncbi:MAG TPA: SPOR domain-containing protein [Gemmatimonadaceae bacterium]|nr:SPOR domain-containing protein [Gemmatimonadaceae bacterium]
MRPAPPPAAHFDRPADVAARLADRAAVIVTGADAAHAATLAVAIARAAAAGRRVAIGDLVGGPGPVYGLAGGEDAAGLAECFRDGLSLNDIARPVPEVDTLFVLPAGAGVDREPALGVRDRWERLIRGFGEAGGLLVLVCRERSPLIGILGVSGAALLYDGTASDAPTGAPLLGTIGAARPTAARLRARGFRGWQVGAAALGAIAVAGWGAIAWTRASNAPDGTVVLHPATRVETPRARDAATRTQPDTVTLVERTPASDQAHLAPFAIAVVAASTAANANSVVRAELQAAGLPAATVAVVAVRDGPRAARWHKVMYGAWRDAQTAEAALVDARRRGVLDAGAGTVARVPYAVLLADSASRERARAVMDVWRAKGVVPYALTQDDGTVRVYAGAFETVAQAVTMAAMVRAAGGGPVVAFRTGRPD